MKHNWENYFDISSEYWKKVEKIYEDSESFPKKVVKERNLHHKFPRSFSKKDGVCVDNDEDNLVSLSLADHFRVHYYLWKCSKKGYRGMMAMAFTLMRKKAVVYASDETIEQIAKDYEEAMKEAAEVKSKAMKGNKNALGKPSPNKGKKLSEETRKKISEGNKGKQAGEKHPNYGKHISEEQKKKIGAANKGRKMSEEAKMKNAEAHKGQTPWNKGKQISEEHKKKISETFKSLRWFNNGKINKRAKECPPGFVPGIIK